MMGYASYRVQSKLSGLELLPTIAATTSTAMVSNNTAAIDTLTSLVTNPKHAMNWYFAQLALNFCWCPAFFGLRNFGLAAAASMTLLPMTVITALLFDKVDHSSGVMMSIYTAWVAIATSLSFIIWRDNSSTTSKYK
jgi:hypothetical protein